MKFQQHILILLISLLSYTTYGQHEHYLYYQLHGFTGKRGILFAIEGSKSIPLDTVGRQSTGAIVFHNIEKYPVGMYRVYFNDSLYTEVIINNENIVLESSITNIIKNMQVQRSTENALLFDYWKLAIATKDSISRLSYEIDKIEKKTYNSNHPKILALKKRIENINNNLKNYVNTIEKEYPKLFAPRLLHAYMYPDYKAYQKAHPQHPYPNEEAFFKDHYFDNIDFSDSRFLHTKVLFVTISDYIKHFGNPASTKRYNAIIDKIMALASANDKVYQYCRNLFMTTFDNSIWENVVVHLIDRYYINYAGDLPQIKAYYAQESALIKSLQPGKEMPDIVLSDTSGNVQNIKEITAKAKIIIFYSSDCSHCTEAMPTLIDIYNMYKEQGLEAFAIALDDDAKKWKDEIKKFNLNWINLSDLKGLSSPLVQTFNIKSTPSIFILNKDNIIMAKPDDMNEIQATLVQLLNQ